MSAHVVYRCYDTGGRLLYIGCTQDLTARMQVHECDSTNPASVELVKHLALLEYEQYPDRTSARKAEREAIRDEVPLLNTHHNLGRGVRHLTPVARPGLSDGQRSELAAIFAGFGAA